MDWIETLFGISPDGGSGTTEALYAVALASVILLVLGWSRQPRRRGTSKR